MQDLLWGHLATGNHLLRELLLPQVLRVRGAASLLHPTLRLCPRYHQGHSYAAGGMPELRKDQLHHLRALGFCVTQLMATEVWELWPWQLDVMDHFEQQQEQQDSLYQQQQQFDMDVQRLLENQQLSPQAQEGSGSEDWESACSGTPASSSRSESLQGTSSSTTTATNSHTPSLPTSSTCAAQGLASSTAAGVSRSTNASSRRVHPRRYINNPMMWPLLPHALPRLASSSSSRFPVPPPCQLAPVTQQQLQLALERVCVTVEMAPQDARSSLLLLVLLLLRAELPQRLAFLQGPWGGLLLAALQLYACDRTPLHDAVHIVQPSLAPDYNIGLYMSNEAGKEGFLELLRRGPQPLILYPVWTAWWLLTCTVLQPEDGWDPATGGSSSSSNSTCDTQPPASHWRPRPLLQFGVPGDDAGEAGGPVAVLSVARQPSDQQCMSPHRIELHVLTTQQNKALAPWTSGVLAQQS
jgi:hypothetical protein